LQTQLKGICQGLEAENVECCVIRMQLKGMCNVLKYIAGISYKAHIVSHVSLASEQGKESSQALVTRGRGRGRKW